MDARIRALAETLWRYHHVNHQLSQADAILVLCSHDTIVAARGADLFLQGWAPLLIFAGGLGSITRRLWREPEANQFARIAAGMGVPEDRMLIENRSTNTGEVCVAGCIGPVAAAMALAIRGDLMADFGRLFALSKVDVGWIAGAAVWGFGLSILVGGPLCDLAGMGTLLGLAAAGHIGGAVATIAAPNFAVLFAATLVIGIANGLVEAAINPLVATIYADDKTRRLVALHAWFPGGIVIGGVLSFLFTQAGHQMPALAPYTGWQAKMPRSGER